MQLRQHLRKRCPVAIALQAELLEKNEIRTSVENPWNADNGAESLQAIRFGLGGRTAFEETFIQRPVGCSRG
jgi:hypothetical protein